MVKGFSIVAKPLTRLTRVDVEFEWDDTAQKAMDNLKELVMKSPVLRTLDYDIAVRNFSDVKELNKAGLVVLAVDLSMHGAGWILYQIGRAHV